MSLQSLIDSAFERRAEFNPKNAPADVRDAVNEAITLLDSGKARVAEKVDGNWQVNQWLKKAVLLSFRLNDNQVVDAGYTQFFDKVPLKYAGYDEARLRAEGVRVVPHAIVRRGAYVASNTVLMPSYVNRSEEHTSELQSQSNLVCRLRHHHLHSFPTRRSSDLSFRLNDNQVVDAGYTQFFDKVPLKYAGYDEARLRAEGVRVVPHAIVRRGAYVASNTVLMPSYVN